MLIPIFYENKTTGKIHVLMCSSVSFRPINTKWMADSELTGDNHLFDVDIVERSKICDNLKDAIFFAKENM